MAKFIVDESYPSKISSLYSWWQIVLAGLGIGLVYYLLALLIGNLIIDPIFCGSALNGQICSSSVEISGNIANILTMVLGLGVLIRLGTLRPLVIAVATAICLWGLSGWSEGLGWLEVIIWNMLLFALGYLTFSWISRYARSLVVLIGALVIVIIARIVVIF